MAGDSRHVGKAVAFPLVLGIVVSSFFVPWWEWGRQVEETTRWEQYGPFQRDERASDGEFGTEATVLGALVALAASTLLLGTVAHVVSAAKRRRASAAWAFVAFLMLAAAVAYTFVAFPQEMSRERNPDVSFVDEECRDLLGSTLCSLTRPALGWFLAILAAVATLALGIAGRLQREREPSVVAPPPRAPEPVAVVHPTSTRGAAPGGPLRAAKCPQCQTRVSFRRPALAECHNCGLRFPA